MKAMFDPGHQMRVIRVEAGPEFDICADVARTVEALADVPHDASQVASFILYLEGSGEHSAPPLCGHDADGLILSLDLARRQSVDEVERMKVNSLLQQVRAGVEVDDLIPVEDDDLIAA